MKIDVCQMIFESIQAAQDECWCDSRYFESIHDRSET